MKLQTEMVAPVSFITTAGSASYQVPVPTVLNSRLPGEERMLGPKTDTKLEPRGERMNDPAGAVETKAKGLYTT